MHVKAGDLVRSTVEAGNPVFLILDPNFVGRRPRVAADNWDGKFLTNGWKVLCPDGTWDIIAFHIHDFFEKVPT